MEEGTEGALMGYPVTVLDQKNAANLARIASSLERIANVMEDAAKETVPASDARDEEQKEVRW